MSLIFAKGANIMSLDFSTQLPDVLRILKHAQPVVTFSGKCVVYGGGSPDATPIEKIAHALFRAEEENTRAGTLTLEDRLIGCEVIDRLQTLERIAQDKVEERNRLTHAFFSARYPLKSLEHREAFCKFTGSDLAQRFPNQRPATECVESMGGLLHLVQRRDIHAQAHANTQK